MFRSGNRYDFLNYFLVAAAILLFYFLHIWDADLGDYTIQINQLQSKGSLVDGSQLNNRYPPLTALVYYSSFKALVFLPVSVVILLLHLALALLIQRGFHLLLAHFCYNTGKGFLKNIVETIVIFNPFIFSFIIRGVNSELLFITCSMYALLFILRNGKNKTAVPLIFSGLFTGFAILTRMQGLALFLSLLAFTCWHFRSWKYIIIFVLAVAFAVTPWQAINSRYSGGFISTGGLPGFRDGLTFNNKKHRSPIALPQKVSTLSDSFYRIYYIEKQQKKIQPAQGEVSFVRQYLASHAATAAQLFWFKFRRSFYGTDSQNHKIELVNRILVSIIMLVFIYFTIILWQQHRYRTLLAWLFFYSALTVGMSVVALSILRYQAPLLPFIFLVCLLGFDRNRSNNTALKPT